MGQADRKKVVFLDIDGTLIMRNQGPYKDDLDAMEEAALKGHYIFLNTGRSFANIHKALLELVFLKGIVAGCGAHILIRQGKNSTYQTIYNKWISDGDLKKIINWYKTKTKCCILEGEENCYYINNTPWPGLKSTAIEINSFEDIKKKNPGERISKITLEGNAAEEEQRFFKPILKLHSFPNYSEAIIKGENKGKAMGIVLKKLGLKKKKRIAVGDSGNDLDMLRSAGLGIAMGNAPEEIKAAADVVTTDCGSGGVAQALRKYVI